MASQREARRIREEEEEKRKRSGPNWGNIILGAASAYLTAGLAPMALGAAASLAPTASNVLMAIKGGVDATSAQTPEAAAMGGIAAGATPTVNKWAQNEAFNATKEAQEKTVAAAEAARREWEKLPENVKYLAKGVSFDDTGKRSYTYENPDTKAKIAKIAAQTAAEKAAAADVLNQNRVSAMKNTGTFKYTETPESTRFNTTLPEPNPNFPGDQGNPRFYTPKPAAPVKPVTTPAVSFGRLSASGANAYSAGQAAIDGGQKSIADVTQAINLAADIPAEEKPTIIRSLKERKKGRSVN